VNTTRRHARSMVEAFGPYTDDRLHPMPTQRPRHEPYLWAMYVLAVAVLAWVVIFD
jgi:hypothetical protein